MAERSTITSTIIRRRILLMALSSMHSQPQDSTHSTANMYGYGSSCRHLTNLTYAGDSSAFLQADSANLNAKNGRNSVHHIRNSSIPDSSFSTSNTPPCSMDYGLLFGSPTLATGLEMEKSSIVRLLNRNTLTRWLCTPHRMQVNACRSDRHYSWYVNKAIGSSSRLVNPS